MRRAMILALCWFALIGSGSAWAKTGSLTGSVSPIAWAPEAEVCLVGVAESCVAPQADGTYQLYATEGWYRVEFLPSYRSRLLKQYYDDKAKLAEAEPVIVMGEEPTASVDAHLVEGGAIVGTVTADGGGPLDEVEVCAVAIEAPESKTCTATDAVGSYELHSLATGQYRVGFWGEGASAEYEPWYFEDRPSLVRGTPVEVTAGSSPERVDAGLAKGGEIQGKVTAVAGGAPLEGIAVCLFALGLPTPQRCAASDDSGSYAFQGLPGGAYEVGFSLEPGELGGADSGDQDGFLSQFYDGVGDRAQAATISLIAGQVVTGVDAALMATPPPSSVGPPPLGAPAVVSPVSTAETPATSSRHRCKALRRKFRRSGKARCATGSRKRRRKRRHRRHPGSKQTGHPTTKKWKLLGTRP